MAKPLALKIAALVTAGAVVAGACIYLLASAAVIRLERYSGTVAVRDEAARALEPREGLRLYDGYQAATMTRSRAWLSLDRHKAVKLEEHSLAKIRKEGRSLTIRLEDGKLFFNVTQPLKENESFTIETATMVTGIRGTCGWVEVLDEYTTQVTLLEGQVETLTTHPETGEERTVTVTGGHTITAVYYGGDGQRAEEADGIAPLIKDGTIDENAIVYTDDGLRVETLKEEDVPEFVADEVAASGEIQDKITENTTLSVPEILGQADPEVLATVPTVQTDPTVPAGVTAPADTTPADTTPAETQGTAHQNSSAGSPEEETQPRYITYEETTQRVTYSNQVDYSIPAVVRYPSYVTNVYSVTEDTLTGEIVSETLISSTTVEDKASGRWFPIENGKANIVLEDGRIWERDYNVDLTTPEGTILPDQPGYVAPDTSHLRTYEETATRIQAVTSYDAATDRVFAYPETWEITYTVTENTTTGQVTDRTESARKLISDDRSAGAWYPVVDGKAYVDNFNGGTLTVYVPNSPTATKPTEPTEPEETEPPTEPTEPEETEPPTADVTDPTAPPDPVPPTTEESTQPTDPPEPEPEEMPPEPEEAPQPTDATQ